MSLKPACGKERARDGHKAHFQRDSLGKTGRRLTSDPIRTSLGLLPSGPDPVGEWLVHRQSPGPYLGPKGPESKLGVIKPGVRTGGDAVGQVRPINSARNTR